MFRITEGDKYFHRHYQNICLIPLFLTKPSPLAPIETSCLGWALQPESRISMLWFYLCQVGIESTLTFVHKGQREVVFCSAFLRSGRASLIQPRALQEIYNFSWIKGFVLLLFFQVLLFKNSKEFLQLSSEIVWLWFGNCTNSTASGLFNLDLTF